MTPMIPAMPPFTILGRRANCATGADTKDGVARRAPGDAIFQNATVDFFCKENSVVCCCTLNKTRLCDEYFATS